MRKIGCTPGQFLSRNTCQHSGRVFHFWAEDDRLAVTEAVLGDRAEFTTVETGAPFYSKGGWWIACCSLGQSILVMSSGSGKYSAVLVTVDEGRLSGSTVHVTGLAVKGKRAWPEGPYLCRIGDAWALLYFYWHANLWYCKVDGPRLIMYRCKTIMPTAKGFCSAPLSITDKKLFVPGSYPRSRKATFITAYWDPTFEDAGYVPKAARRDLSTALVKDRFVLGFGGRGDGPGELWVFDLQTQRSSEVRREGEWRRDDWLVPLVVQGDTLYLVGGLDSEAVHSLPLASLPDLIPDSAISSAFREAFPVPPEQAQEELADLTARLATSYQRTSCIPALREEIASLNRKRQRLEAELRELFYPRFTALLRVSPVRSAGLALPLLSRAAHWSVDPGRLRGFRESAEEHARGLPDESSVLSTYEDAFGPLLDPGLPLSLFRALSFAPAEALRLSLLAQLVAALGPGVLLPRGLTLRPLFCAPGLRVGAKLLDSGGARHAAQLAVTEGVESRRILARAPPAYRAALGIVNTADPLAAERAQGAGARVRLAERTSLALRGMETASGLAGVKHCLQRAEAASQGECPGAWYSNEVEGRSVAVDATVPVPAPPQTPPRKRSWFPRSCAVM